MARNSTSAKQDVVSASVGIARQSDLSFSSLKPDIRASEVSAELKKIGGSSEMVRSQRLVQLLNFLVEMTQKGMGVYLKETTIGVSVFERPPDYDPKTDTIVRSQIWRLRAKLDKYYATEGQHDSVVISIPKGQYLTVFSRKGGTLARAPR